MASAVSCSISHEVIVQILIKRPLMKGRFFKIAYRKIQNEVLFKTSVNKSHNFFYHMNFPL